MCTDIGDDYEEIMLGKKATMPIAKAQNYLDRRDALTEIFERKEAENEAEKAEKRRKLTTVLLYGYGYDPVTCIFTPQEEIQAYVNGSSYESTDGKPFPFHDCTRLESWKIGECLPNCKRNEHG